MLPIRKVVLFQHGVGYFEREGEITDDARVELAFQSREMNDVLKSLTTLDLDGGHIANIAYESTQPLSKQLERVQLRLPEDRALTGLLTQLQGASVEVDSGSHTLVGLIMGIETAHRADREQVVPVPLLTLLLEAGGMRTIDLREVSQLRLRDPHLQGDLVRLLEVLVQSKREDLKRLTILARGKGRRRLHVSYVVEAPVWKTSYRILLGAEPGSAPLLQGWALVDNTQEEDWKDVDLALVAGLPISFVHDLHTARYRRRPVVAVADHEAYAPPVLESGMAAPAAAPAAGAEEMLAEDSELDASAGFAGRRRMAKVLRSTARQAMAPPAVATREISDLFQYQIEHPVTVRRGESALVPILQSTFDGQRVLVYNPDVREHNPMSAVRLLNDTGMTLEGGPVTVLEDDDYVGEAMLQTIKPGGEQLLPYSVELGCLVRVEAGDALGDVHRLRLVHGNLHSIRYRLLQRTYVLDNRLDRAFQVYLDHRLRQGWALIDTPAPIETTDNFHRFRIEIAGKTQQTFTVTERGEQSEAFALIGVDHARLATFLQRPRISSALRQSLDQIGQRNMEIANLQQQVHELDQQVERGTMQQQRLRENLAVLQSTEDERELRQRWIRELSNSEERLQQHAAQRQTLDGQRQALEHELHTMLANLDLDSEC